MSESHEARIAREEEYWTAPRLFAFGISFIVVSIVVIYIMSSI